MPESTEERYKRSQEETNRLYTEYLAEKAKAIGPETEVWVSHNLRLTKKMTLKDLALQLRVPLSDLIDPERGIRYADTVVEKNAQWIDIITFPDGEDEDWEVEEDDWYVTEIR